MTSGKHTTPRINFTAPPRDVDRWRVLAAEVGLTLAEWIREACEEKAREQRRG